MFLIYALLYILIACIIVRVVYAIVDEDDALLALIVFCGMLWPIAFVVGGAYFLSKHPASWIVRQIKK